MQVKMGRDKIQLERFFLTGQSKCERQMAGKRDGHGDSSTPSSLPCALSILRTYISN